MRSPILWSALGALGLLIFVLWEPRPETGQAVPVEAESVVTIADEIESLVMAEKLEEIQDLDPAPLKDFLPSVEKLKEESIHSGGLPPSILRFASQLASRVEEVNKNEALSSRLFDELENCIGASPIIQVQALCLNEARQLVKKDGRLSDRYARMKKQADRRAIDIANELE